MHSSFPIYKLVYIFNLGLATGMESGKNKNGSLPFSGHITGVDWRKIVWENGTCSVADVTEQKKKKEVHQQCTSTKLNTQTNVEQLRDQHRRCLSFKSELSHKMSSIEKSKSRNEQWMAEMNNEWQEKCARKQVINSRKRWQ